jgi:hypothetical protein
MEFKDQFTTQAKINTDKDNIEIKKTLISNDAFAVGQELSKLNLLLAREAENR